MGKKNEIPSTAPPLSAKKKEWVRGPRSYPVERMERRLASLTFVEVSSSACIKHKVDYIPTENLAYISP